MGSSGSDPSRPGDASRPGFSIIELLVVIAVVSVLLALLLPALGAARNESVSLVCRANLRNVAQAHAHYNLDNRGLWANDFGPDTQMAVWLLGNTQYEATNSFFQVKFWFGPLDAAGVINVWNDSEALQCPQAARWVRDSLELNPQVGPMWSYAYSPAFFTNPALWDPAEPQRRDTPDAWRRYVAVDDAAHPSQKVASFEFADHHGSGAVIGSDAAPPDHRSNAAFADGHVKRVRPADAVPALSIAWEDFYGPTTPQSLPFSCAPFGSLGRDFD